MNLMGGLSKGMPRAALLFLVGSVAICGIPPLNGFISEFLLYFGLFSQLQANTLVYLAMLAPLLALVGGLAVIAFTKLYSSVFLGTARSHDAAHHHEPPMTMLLPMALFALLCLMVGILPQLAFRLVSPALATFMPQVAATVNSSDYSAMLVRLSLFSLLLLAVAGLVTLLWLWRLNRSPVTSASTWGCGYLQGTPRMQYAATSFSESAVSVFNGIIRQRVTRPTLRGLFPAAARCSDVPTETVLERIVSPLFSLVGLSFGFLHRLQHGQMHIYILYIFVTLFILMLWGH
jgi:hydrogenase-4 component B